MINEYFSISDFAKKLKVHPNTIRRAIKNKRIQALRIGKTKNSAYRIPESEILRMAHVDLEETIEKEVEKRIKERSKI